MYECVRERDQGVPREHVGVSPNELKGGRDRVRARQRERARETKKRRERARERVRLTHTERKKYRRGERQ